MSTSAGSNEPASSAKKGKKRKEADAAAGVDLSAMYQATPGGSKNRGTMKELMAERKKIQKEQNAKTKQIRMETQRQRRLIEKANRLSNNDLLEMFRQRHENQEAAKAKAKAKSKAKAKAKCTANGPLVQMVV